MDVFFDRMKKWKICIIAIAIIIIIWKLYGAESDVQEIDENTELKAIVDDFISPVTIYCITPTYWRHVQKAELIRILQTLILASFRVNIKWLVVEDSLQKTNLVINLLKRVDIEGHHIEYVHLNAKTPPFHQLKDKDARWTKHRGVEQRNAALQWIRLNVKPKESKKILFFMDDDNTYDVKLFEEIAKVQKVGVWPVGLVGGFNIETPILDPKTGRIKSYKSGWKENRPFAIDMAGFGINVDLILNRPEAVFAYTVQKGYQESQFLSFFTTKEELEPLADNCTKVYVWHTRTQKPDVKYAVPGYEV